MMNRVKIATLLTFLALSFKIWALEPLPGLVPLFYSIPPATDLSYQGQQLSPERAHQLVLEQNLDLSSLDPLPGSNIWRANSVGLPLLNDDLGLGPQSEVNYDAALTSRLGLMRFTGYHNDAPITFALGKKAHNILLRKNLLRKLGYIVPTIQWLPKLKINFSSKIDKELFINALSDKTIASSDRWIIGQGEHFLILQDVLAMSPKNDIYNLALGTFPSNLVQGRRLLRSLYLPLALVDIPESMNSFSWQAGRVVLENLKLYHSPDLDNSYGPGVEDARWITKQISKLTRNDWQEIVEHSAFPTPVAKLLIEKLISRRNHLNQLLSLSLPELSFSPEVTLLPDLKDGEIVTEKFPGFASRFAYGDPESPFSATEISHFFLSEGIGALISNAVGAINSLPLMGVDEEGKVQEHFAALFEEHGPFERAPLGAFAFPTASGNLILSREVVAGSYMGTSNRVQLVDTIGAQVEAGVFVGVEGLPDTAGLSLRGTLFYHRTYSHIRPLKTLKQATKTPFKNMLVPLLKRQAARNLEAPDSELTNALSEVLGVGDSLIITDTLGGGVGVQANITLSGMAFYDPRLLKLYAGVDTARLQVSRLHITRVDEDTVHIYKDRGQAGQKSFSLKLNSYVPLISFRTRKTSAKAQVRYVSLEFSGDKEEVKDNTSLLNQVLLTHETDELMQKHPPYIVEHDVTEKVRQLNPLLWRLGRIKSFDQIDVAHPTGAKLNFSRRYDAKISGLDLENYAREAVSLAIELIWDKDIDLTSTESINPGLTIFGKSKSSIFTTEIQHSNNGAVNEWHTTLKLVDAGWKASKSALKKDVAAINKRFDAEIIPPLAIRDTDKILLHQTSFDLTINNRGCQKLLSLSSDHFRNLLRQHARGDKFYQLDDIRRISPQIGPLQKKIQKELSKDQSKALQKFHELVELLTDNLSLEGIKIALGSENILAVGRVDGFRHGDEQGDSPVLANASGSIPSKDMASPLEKIANKTGISLGELTLNWFMERAL
jgi:hypothetical protein